MFIHGAIRPQDNNVLFACIIPAVMLCCAHDLGKKKNI